VVIWEEAGERGLGTGRSSRGRERKANPRKEKRTTAEIYKKAFRLVRRRRAHQTRGGLSLGREASMKGG